jgi:predicted dehydrogenase
MTEVRKVCSLVRSGELGRIYVAELIFHNAYGPDKSWFYDAKLSGGGCVIDLGIHLVDLALWALGFPNVENVSSRLFCQGRSMARVSNAVEDYGTATLDLANGGTVQIHCSWKLAAGRDAIISGTFYGSEGGASFHNVDGSFYEFAAERFRGTKRELLAQTGETWGGKAAVDWATRLANGQQYDPAIEHLNTVAETLDRIYRR